MRDTRRPATGLHSLEIALYHLEDRIHQHRFLRLRTDEQVRVGARLTVEELVNRRSCPRFLGGEVKRERDQVLLWARCREQLAASAARLQQWRQRDLCSFY